MGNRKWFIVGLALCLLLGSVLPATANFKRMSWLSCTLKFDSAHDDTESRGRGVYTIPATGGNAILLVGVYAWRPFLFQEEFEAEEASVTPEANVDSTGVPWEDLQIPLSAQVKVVFRDAENPEVTLFTFEGTLGGLMALTGAEVVFSGPYGVLIKIPLVVPPGETDWIGRLEVIVGGTQAHCDVILGRGYYTPDPA